MAHFPSLSSQFVHNFWVNQLKELEVQLHRHLNFYIYFWAVCILYNVYNRVGKSVNLFLKIRKLRLASMVGYPLQTNVKSNSVH